MDDVSRRDFLGAVAVGGVLAGTTSAGARPAGAREPASFPGGSDPRRSGLGQIKMEAALDGRAGIWGYRGLIYAVRPDCVPLPILGLDGGSAFWGHDMGGGAWEMTGTTMSFFTDPDSGRHLDTFTNPFTGKTDAVRANILAGGARMVYPADGAAPHFVGQSSAGESTPGGFVEADGAHPVGRVAWTTFAGGVAMTTDHAFEVPVQPQLEARTIRADAASFFDPSVRRLPAQMTTTTITPWLRFMGMEGQPGHLVWHCWGEKVFDVADLADSYRAGAGDRIDLFVTPPARP